MIVDPKFKYTVKRARFQIIYVHCSDDGDTSLKPYASFDTEAEALEFLDKVDCIEIFDGALVFIMPCTIYGLNNQPNR